MMHQGLQLCVGKKHSVSLWWKRETQNDMSLPMVGGKHTVSLYMPADLVEKREMHKTTCLYQWSTGSHVVMATTTHTHDLSIKKKRVNGERSRTRVL